MATEDGGETGGPDLWADVPTMFGCRTHHELSRVRHWDKNMPGQILGALPKQKWLRQLPHRGQDLLATLWRQVEDKSPATRSRWPWTWVGDDSVCKKSGQQLGLRHLGQRPGTSRPTRHRWAVRLVVIGEGQLLIPVDFTVHRPDPGGLAGPAVTS